jgi:HK97 family phage portal protein
MILDILTETKRATSIEGFHPSSPLFQGLWDVTRETTSGESVTQETAATVSAVYAAVRWVSWTRAILALCVYERKENGDKEAQKDHPVYRVIHTRPNPDMAPVTYYAQQSAYELLWGYSVGYIEKTQNGEVGAVWPLPAWGVKLGRFGDGSLAFDVSSLDDKPTPKDVLMASEVVHVPNIVIPAKGEAMPTVAGRSVVSYAREALGEQIAAQKFGGGFYAGGSLFSFALKKDGKLGPEAVKNLRAGLEKVHGYKRRTPIFEDGLEPVPLGMPLRDMQFIEARQGLYIQDVARWFSCPPHILADLSRATFSNIAEQKLEAFERLLPWLMLTAQEYSYKLFTEAEQQRLFVEHVTETILKADIKTRYEAYERALMGGFMNRDEVRQKENMNRMPKGGKVHTVHAGVQNVEALTEKPKEEKPQEPTQPPGVVEDAARKALENGLRHAIGKEQGAARHAAEDPGKFLGWLDRYYPGYEAKMASILTPACDVCRVVGVSADPVEIARTHCEASHQALLGLSGEVTAEHLRSRVEEETTRWEAEISPILKQTFNGEHHANSDT